MLANIRSRIYFITPAEITDSKQLFRLVQAVVRSGVGMIQYRAKHQPTRAMVEEARALLKITRPAQVPLSPAADGATCHRWCYRSGADCSPRG